MALGRFYRIAILGLSFGLLGACQNNSGSSAVPDRPVPLPGQEQRLQFYFLFERDAAWGLPPVAAIRDALGARVDMNFYESDAQAEALLRSWSARPADLVLLGPGRPQVLHDKLLLAKTDARHVILFGSDKEPRIDMSAINSLLARLCGEAFSLGKGCELISPPEGLSSSLPKGSLKVSFGTPSPEAQIWIGIEWVNWFQRLFHPNAAGAYLKDPKVLGFSEGLLSARVNSSVPAAKAEDLDRSLKAWKLENL
jgi:hypothetical protein